MYVDTATNSLVRPSLLSEVIVQIQQLIQISSRDRYNPDSTGRIPDPTWDWVSGLPLDPQSQVGSGDVLCTIVCLLLYICFVYVVYCIDI